MYFSRLYVFCLFVCFTHALLKYAVSFAFYSGKRREKTHEIKCVRLRGWVVAGRLDEPPGRGDINETVSHRLV